MNKIQTLTGKAVSTHIMTTKAFCLHFPEYMMVHKPKIPLVGVMPNMVTMLTPPALFAKDQESNSKIWAIAHAVTVEVKPCRILKIVRVELNLKSASTSEWVETVRLANQAVTAKDAVAKAVKKICGKLSVNTLIRLPMIFRGKLLMGDKKPQRNRVGNQGEGDTFST